jgi:hypothetical protein
MKFAKHCTIIYIWTNISCKNGDKKLEFQSKKKDEREKQKNVLD